MPASAHSDAMFAAWTSEPPASGSSRSRHASMLTRSRPASAAMSPSLATSAVVVGSPARAFGRALSTGPDHSRGIVGREHAASGGAREDARAAMRHEPGPDSLSSHAMARLTGERPMEGATPDSLLAFHAAGYREMRDRLGAGVGARRRAAASATRPPSLAGLGRTVVGVDYDPDTAVDAGRELGRRRAALRGDGRRRARRPRPLDRLGVLVAHHRALRVARAARRRARAGLRAPTAPRS